MFRGFNALTSGMVSQQRVQEALSENVANVNTPGYKADEAVLRAFPEMLLKKMGSNEPGLGQGPHQTRSGETVGSINTGAYVQELIPHFNQGPIRETGQPTDLALVDGELPDENGSLFFTVENEDGDTRYTRNGHLTVDSEGFLTTNDGSYVLNDNANRIQTNGMDFLVTSDGEVQTDGMNANIAITYIDNTDDMVKDENDLFILDGDANAQDARGLNVTFSVMQNTLEGSNVDAEKTMTDMMSTYRLFEQNQRMLRAYDENMGKAVSEVGRLG